MLYLPPKRAKHWLDEHHPGHGLSERGLRFLIKSGRIPSVAASAKKRLINVEQIERYLADGLGKTLS